MAWEAQDLQREVFVSFVHAGGDGGGQLVHVVHDELGGGEVSRCMPSWWTCGWRERGW